MKTIGFRVIAAILLLVFLLVGCADKPGTDGTQASGSQNQGASDEELFVWKGNMIAGLTDKGNAQKNLVIPAKCEGFTDIVFLDCEADTVSFEDDDDIDLDCAFMGAKVKSVILPDGLTKITSMAFQGCKNLEKIVLPGALEELGSYAFDSCVKLSTVEFRGTRLKTISRLSFDQCETLSSIAIPEGVEVIEESAFFQCGQLADVTFPGTLKTIEENAFNETALTELRFPEQVTDLQIGGTSFGAYRYSMKVYVAAGSWLDQNREKWDTGFGEIIAQ